MIWYFLVFSSNFFSRLSKVISPLRSIVCSNLPYGNANNGRPKLHAREIQIQTAELMVGNEGCFSKVANSSEMLIHIRIISRLKPKSPKTSRNKKRKAVFCQYERRVSRPRPRRQLSQAAGVMRVTESKDGEVGIFLVCDKERSAFEKSTLEEKERPHEQ